MKKFYSDIEALCGLTVAGTTSLGTATGVTVATSDNSTKLATTAFVKAQGYLTAEVDTLDTVTDRNSVTTNSIGVGTVNIIGTTAGAELLTVDGTFGRLFTVTDDLSDSLFSVNTIAGLPVIEVFADNTINLGAFSNPITIDGSSNIVIPGTITASGYNDTNWNTAYNDRIVSAAVSGTTTKTLTLTQTDGGTISTSWTDINTDTDGYISNVSLVGSTLSFTSVGSAFSGIIDLSALTPTVRTVYETVKNVSGATILKGTPLAVVAGQTSGNVSDVIPADAADPAKMPAVFIANENILDQTEGEAVLFGRFSGVDTSLYQSGTTVYVAPGGGWTATKPVYPNLIQNLGVITKQHATNGGGIVTGVGRANALPNLTAGKIWVGSASYPIESTTVHVDEANARVGIGTTSPAFKLQVNHGTTSEYVTSFRNTADNLQLKIGTTTGALLNIQGATINTNVAYNIALQADGGNVGIGTTSPSAKLQVAGTFNVSGDATFNGSNTYINSSNILVGNNTTDVVGISGNSMYFPGNGNVGVGTTSPAFKLHVLGAVGGDSTFTGGILIDNNNATDGESALAFRVNSMVTAGNYWLTGLNQTNNYSIAYGTSFTDANTLFRVSANGNVGIGTTSPVSKLHVNSAGGSGVTTQIKVTQADDGAGHPGADAILESSGWGEAYLKLGGHKLGAYGGILNIDSSSHIAFNLGSERVRITSAGNVGIGTTSPVYKLQVNADGAGLYVRGASVSPFTQTIASFVYGGNSNSIDIENQGGKASIQARAGASTMDLLLNAAGSNVGIGTTSPGYKLDVNGSARVNNTLWVNNSNGTAVINAYSGGQIGTYLAKSSSATANFTTTGVSYPRGLGFGAIIGQGNTTDIPVNNASWNGGYGGNIGFWSDVHYGVEGGTNSIGFNAVIKGSGNSNSYGFFSDLSGATDGTRYGIYTKGEQQNYFSGSVGIGTTAPASKLHVNPATVNEIAIAINGTQNYSANSFQRISAGDPSSLNRVAIGFGYNSTPEWTIRYSSYHNHEFFTGNDWGSSTEKMRITAAGNVGIGTTSPTQKLDVTDGDFVVRDAANVNKVTLTRFGGVELRGNGTGYRTVGTPNTDALSLATNNTSRIYITSAGNVGIGTTSPTNKFQVANGNMSITSGYSFILADTDTNWRLGRNIIVESGNYLTASTFQLVAANAANEGWQFVNDDGFTVLEIGAETSARHVWINAGNLSVGVASPQEKIHVAGNVRIDGGSTAAILETNNATAGEAGTTYRTFTTADHYAVFVDYVIYDAGRANMRTGTFRAVWSTGDVVYTDVSTVDLGATDNVVLSAAISGANVNLIVTGPADYTLKYNLKVIK